MMPSAAILPALPALLRFAAACGACAILGVALAALLRLALRRWPALEAHRTVWLACQGALLLAVVLALAPLPRAGLALALALPSMADGAPARKPATPLSVPAPDAKSAVLKHAGKGQASDVADGRRALNDPASGARQAGIAAAAPAPAPDILATIAAAALLWLAPAWLVVYTGGLLALLLRRQRAARRWNATLRRHLRPLAPHGLAAWPGAAADQVERIVRGHLAVATTDLPLSPMLLGVLRPRLLLPAQLDGFDAAQRVLIVEHELTHWRRRDPLWLAASGCIASLLWFVPACRRLDAGLREAVELGCDDAVLAGRPAAERRSYAAALVAQLRRQAVHAPPSMAPAFGQLGVAARVARMRDLRPARLSGRARCTLALTALTLAVATAGLQPTLPAAPALTTAATTTPPHLPAMPAPPIPGWRYPLQGARVTALYGVRSTYVPAGHHGVDFAARRGDAVLAVAAGRVREAGADPVWGNFVRVDHGAGRQSLVMHLDRIDVARGQDVASGQRLGAAGATGGATGPHLHLEYWQDGRRGDPARMFADLDRHATPRALARRAAQGHPQPIDG